MCYMKPNPTKFKVNRKRLNLASLIFSSFGTNYMPKGVCVNVSS